MAKRRKPPRPHIPPRQPGALSVEEAIALLTACVDLIGRTGAEGFWMRFQDDEEPVVWIAQARYQRDGREVYEIDAALDPTRAAFRLCERLVDGGQCQHCHRPTGITEDFGPVLAEEVFCWYQFDPELKTFRRACEGEPV